MTNYAQLLTSLTDAMRFPALDEVVVLGDLDRATPPDALFSFGLERILDGIEALISGPG